MNKIEISNNKTLKLTNVLTCNVDIEGEENILTVVSKMDNYIKSKGALPIGPLIQKNEFSIDHEGKITFSIFLMRQANNFIHSVAEPYTINSVVKIQNCMYAHYLGPEEKIQLAYDKLNVTAFEEDIELSNENYTISVDQHEDNIVADIFVEKKTDE